MKPILYDAAEQNFTSNGLGRLNPVRCLVTEERNGQYELEMDISMEDRHYADIKEGRIIFAYHDDTKTGQPFEIYQISRPIDGMVTVSAWHISYRTMKMSVMPFTARSCSAAMGLLASNVIGDCPFTFHTDMTTAADITFSTPVTLRNVLGGSDGSILDTYGGEFEWDKWRIYLRSARGTQTNVVLRYGKNITDLKKVTDITNVWTGIAPYWVGQDSNGAESIVTLPEKAIYSGSAGNYAYRMTIPVDLSGNFSGKPTEAQLREAAQLYVQNHAPSGIPATVDVSFVQLWQTQEYQNVAALERLKLCDTLTVRYDRLGVSNTAKIIKTVYDVLLERYESMTIGDIKSTLGDTIMAAAEEIKKTAVTKTAMQRAIEAATALIQGGLGGHVVINTDNDGHPNEILIMDTDSTATAVNVLRINMNGIGFSRNGYNGPFHSAWTLDGAFVADYITAGTLNAAIIKAGILSDEAGLNFWDMVTGEFRLASTTKIGTGDDTIVPSSAISAVVTGTDVEYGNSDSSSTPPSTWTTNANWQKGKYLWMRTKMTLKSGGTQYSDARMIANGSGIGVSKVVEEYYLSTSNQSPVGGSWVTSQPIWVKGHYYWTRSRIEWADGSTSYTDDTLASALTSGNQSTDNLDTALDQRAIFNRLTNNGQTQGIYLNNGRLYINATYIATGTLADANNNVTFDLSTGTLTMKKGSINIGNGIFIVDTNGNLTATSATLEGTVVCGNKNSYWMQMAADGTIKGGYGSTTRGTISPMADVWAVLPDGSGVARYYGTVINGDAINFQSKIIAVSDDSTGTFNTYTGGTGTLNYISKLTQDPLNQECTWTNASIQFVNGIMVTAL